MSRDHAPPTPLYAAQLSQATAKAEQKVPTVNRLEEVSQICSKLEDLQIFRTGPISTRKQGTVPRHSIAVLIKTDSNNLRSLNFKAGTLQIGRMKALFAPNEPDTITTVVFDGSPWYSCHFEDPAKFNRFYNQLTQDCREDPAKWIFMRSRLDPRNGGIDPREDEARLLIENVIALTCADALATCRGEILRLVPDLCPEGVLEPPRTRSDVNQNPASVGKLSAFSVYVSLRTVALARLVVSLMRGKTIISRSASQLLSPEELKTFAPALILKPNWISSDSCPRCLVPRLAAHCNCCCWTVRLEHPRVNLDPVMVMRAAHNLRSSTFATGGSRARDQREQTVRSQHKWATIICPSKPSDSDIEFLTSLVAMGSICRYFVGQSTLAPEIKCCAACGERDIECGGEDHIPAHEASQKQYCPAQLCLHPDLRNKRSFHNPDARPAPVAPVIAAGDFAAVARSANSEINAAVTLPVSTAFPSSVHTLHFGSFAPNASHAFPAISTPGLHQPHRKLLS